MKNESLIIQICPCYVDLDHEGGGVANVVSHICRQLSARRRHVLLICGNRELGKVKAPPGRKVIDEFLTVEILAQRWHPLLGPTNELICRLQALSQDSVAHVHTCFSAFTEGAMSQLHSRKIPFIFTPHGKLSRQFVQRHYWPKRLWWLGKARRLVNYAETTALCSVGEADQVFQHSLNRPVDIVPNGFDMPLATDDRHAVPIIQSPYVLFLGYLDPRKQPEFLAEAYNTSKASQSHLLVFAGPNAYSHQDNIQRKAEELGIQGRVVFYGPAYGAEKWNLLRNAACLCLPSLGEGLPVVLCEALGAGTPSVFSKECNFSELATEGAGIMIGDFEPTVWGDAIDKICLEQAVQKKMKAAAEVLRSRYSWEEIVKQWCLLYDRADKAH
jgi:glycosyltransferase involved in cell wall biosynthesis